MLNLYTAIKESSLFRKMEVSELLFIEYTCMQEETKFGIGSNNNYFVFASAGKKMWKSIYNSYEVNDGDIIIEKKAKKKWMQKSSQINGFSRGILMT